MSADPGAPDPRDALLRGLVERVRARLGGIRAAVETLDAFPEMPAEARAQFQAVVRDEALALGREVEAAAADAVRLASGPSASAADVLAAALAALAAAGMPARALGPASEVRLAVDPAEVGTLLVALAALTPAAGLGVRVEPRGRLAAVDLSWDGPALPAEALAQRLRAPLADGEPPLADVLAALDAAVAAEPDGPGRGRLRLLVPTADGPTG